jgi:MraZ protein
MRAGAQDEDDPRSGTRPGDGRRGEVTVFVGTFEHTLDGKGRIVLPATFRNELAGRGIVSQYENCLGVWTIDGFGEVARRLQDKVREGLTTHNAVRAFAANAVQVEPDTQGRILLPPRLREYAALDKDAVIIGAIDRIEIWNAERWQTVSSEADESLLSAVTDLGI